MPNILVQYGNPNNNPFVFDSKKGFPTPTLSIDVNHVRTGPGDYITTEQMINLEGVCYVGKMVDQNDVRNYDELSPNEKSQSIVDLINKVQELETAITSRNNGLLVVGIPDIRNIPFLVSGNAKLEEINFNENENNWTNTIDYSIVFKIYVSGTGSPLIDPSGFAYVESVTDSYSLEPMYENQYIHNNRYYPTYKLTRNIGAVGKRVTSASGSLYHAKKWVVDREQWKPLTGILDPSVFSLYNHERSVNFSEVEGSYSITDTCIAKSGDPWIENFTMSLDIDDKFKRTISINGTVQGLAPAFPLYNKSDLNIYENNILLNPSGKLDIYPTTTGFPSGGYASIDVVIRDNVEVDIKRVKYQNAVSGYREIVDSNTVFSRAKEYDLLCQNLITDNFHGKKSFSDYKNKALNSIPLSINDALYPFEGKINYSATYDTRPTGVISGALFESFSVDDKLPVVRTEEIKVLGRRLGPIVYEYYNSPNAGTRTVSYEGVFPRQTGLKKYYFPREIIRQLDNALMLYQPQLPYTGFITENTENLNITTNTISRSITWEYTKCSDF
jgi:hypothetical protein